MEQPVPLETLEERGRPSYLMQRDPMLAKALEKHGAEWRPDLHAKLELPRNDEKGLPGIVLTTLEHTMEWPHGTDRAIWKQWWNSRQGHWHCQMTLQPLPETMAAAIEGRCLSDVIDAPGADAWTIASVDLVTGVHTQLTMRRTT